MGISIGIDIGTSAIKYAALSRDEGTLGCKRTDVGNGIAEAEQGLRSFITEFALEEQRIDVIGLTGIRAALDTDHLAGIPVHRVTEFAANGAGGLFLSHQNEAIVCSMGTGTAIVSATPEGFRHVGGSAVGGGTLVGLCRRLFGLDDVGQINKLAEQGNLKMVDWSIAEVSGVEMPTLPDFATSSNLGKMDARATDADVALGIINMIFQTSGTLAVFACRNENLNSVVMVGTAATIPAGRTVLEQVGLLYGTQFIVPENAPFAAAIGAAKLAMASS